MICRGMESFCESLCFFYLEVKVMVKSNYEKRKEAIINEVNKILSDNMRSEQISIKIEIGYDRAITVCYTVDNKVVEE